jgi:hypothetical protein
LTPISTQTSHSPRLTTATPEAAKLREYIWAGGDIDGYARSGRRSDITDGDWFLIDGMLSAFSIIRRGLAADTFKKQHQDQVRKAFDSMETYQALQDYEAQSEPGTAPIGGPATQLGDTRATEGPPSVS